MVQSDQRPAGQWPVSNGVRRRTLRGVVLPGFQPPDELGAAPFAQEVINVLNTPIANAQFTPVP